MAIPVNELHKDVIFEHRGEIFSVLKYEHKSIARGKAEIKIKAKNLSNGANIELGFKSGQVVDEVDCRRQNMEFVYIDERKKQLVLSDMQTKKRYPVPMTLVSENKVKYLTQGQIVQALILADNHKVMSVDIPITVELRVEEAPPAEKGDTASGGSKPATLTTGAVIDVPLFIKRGNIIKVNTERDEYMGRVSDS